MLLVVSRAVLSVMRGGSTKDAVNPNKEPALAKKPQKQKRSLHSSPSGLQNAGSFLALSFWGFDFQFITYYTDDYLFFAP